MRKCKKYSFTKKLRTVLEKRIIISRQKMTEHKISVILIPFNKIYMKKFLHVHIEK